MALDRFLLKTTHYVKHDMFIMCEDWGTTLKALSIFFINSEQVLWRKGHETWSNHPVEAVLDLKIWIYL